MNSRCVYINNNEFGQFLEHHVLVEKLQEKTAVLSECENKLWLLLYAKATAERYSASVR